jgi:hypothetical protein
MLQMKDEDNLSYRTCSAECNRLFEKMENADLVIAASFLKTFLSDGDDFRTISWPRYYRKKLFFPCMLHYSNECEKAWCRGGERSVLKYSEQLWPRISRKHISANSQKLKSRYGARNRFQEPSLKLSIAKLPRLAGRYDNPMPAWFLAPIAGLKLPTLIYSNPQNGR